jgi:two-component system response regulator CpxR
MPGDAASPPARVLIVDDDRKLCRLLVDYLGPMGYEATCVHHARDGLEKAAAGGWSAIVLDVMLPGGDGFEVLRQLRRVDDTPVLMLTARGDETDRVVGLELGADDYLPKPFSTRELLARLRAITRRREAARTVLAGEGERPARVVCGDLWLDVAARTATRGGEPLRLTSLEFDLLHALMKAAGRVLSRDQLLDQIAGREYEVYDRSIDVHISALRRKLGDDPKRPRYIKTVRNAGYLLARQPGADE